jgi:hypothetical protein
MALHQLRWFPPRPISSHKIIAGTHEKTTQMMGFVVLLPSGKQT